MSFTLRIPRTQRSVSAAFLLKWDLTSPWGKAWTFPPRSASRQHSATSPGSIILPSHRSWFPPYPLVISVLVLCGQTQQTPTPLDPYAIASHSPNARAAAFETAYEAAPTGQMAAALAVITRCPPPLAR